MVLLLRERPTTDDFEIRIRPAPGDGMPSPVEVRVTPGDQREDSTFSSPFSPEEIDEARQWLEQGTFDRSSIKEFGAKLFDSLFVDPVKGMYEESQVPSDPPRLRLVIDDPDAARIPWELLYDPEREFFPALTNPLVRALSLAEPAEELETDAPLRILVLLASPRGLPQLQAKVEARGLKKALSRLVRKRKVELQTYEHATVSSLRNALREATAHAPSRPIHILHFIGHAGRDPATGRTVLAFEDEGQDIDPVDPERLMSILRGFDIRLVFLNACQTLDVSSLDATREFAPALLRGGVPAVIGMQVVVLDEVAARFAREFYEAIADNRPVDLAVLDARLLVRNDRSGRTTDMSIPVCYLRSADGRIMTIRQAQEVSLTRETWRPWLWQHVTSPSAVVKTVYWLMGATLVVVGFWQLVAPVIWPEPPKPMDGEINIAVADFASLDASGEPTESPEASGLASTLYDKLQEELSTSDLGFDIEVRPPEETGPLFGRTASERAVAAEDLTEAIRADVVLYGTLSADGVTFDPEFFISGRQLAGAEELIGEYRLGTPLNAPVNISGNPAAHKDLRERLQERTKALAQFVIGLSYFMIGNFTDAEESLEMAASNEAWADEDGKEVVHIFLGNTYLRQDRPAAARDSYEHALGIKEGYSRALFGLSEIDFHEVTAKGCDRGEIDEEGLYETLADYQRAADAPQPTLSDIPTKVHFAVGRIDMCLSQGLVEDRWAHGERELLTVIDAYDAGNERIKQLAAESHAILAGVLVYRNPDAERPGAADAYRSAVRHFITAIELSNLEEERRALFEKELGRACEQLELIDVHEPGC